jgi:hypothetical protein
VARGCCSGGAAARPGRRRPPPPPSLDPALSSCLPHPQVCLVGSRQFNTFGSHGASDFVPLRHFPTIEACCEWLRTENGAARGRGRRLLLDGGRSGNCSPPRPRLTPRPLHDPAAPPIPGCRIVGVEIDESAVPVQSHPFVGNTAFMLGNEVRPGKLPRLARASPLVHCSPLQRPCLYGPSPSPQTPPPLAPCSAASQGQGLSAKQMRLCDGFVYIPQHGAGTASLNVTVAASIILHHFALWAGLPERGREGAKFVVGDRPQRTHGRGAPGGEGGCKGWGLRGEEGGRRAPGRVAGPAGGGLRASESCCPADQAPTQRPLNPHRGPPSAPQACCR